MKFTVDFRKEAHQDILEAVEWYESRIEGLGDELFLAIEKAKHFIEINPYYYEDKYRGIRKAIVARFPYILYYQIIDESRVLVYAVLHMKRSPKIWKKRKK